MANKNLFKSLVGRFLPATDAVNEERAPAIVRDALQDAMEVAIHNVLEFPGQVYVCPASRVRCRRLRRATARARLLRFVALMLRLRREAAGSSLT